jgi:hypothetical protein
VILLRIAQQQDGTQQLLRERWQQQRCQLNTVGGKFKERLQQGAPAGTTAL